MERVVLDTNSLIQCISKRSSYHRIWESILKGERTLCVSNDIIEEYEEVLERNISHRFAVLAINVIINNPYTLFITPYYHFNLIQQDPDDNKFVDCAVSANARFIVTEDHHFNILKSIEFPRVEIIGLDDFIKQI